MSDTTYASTADDTFRQFRAKLNELFQMDRAELDFGIYRIMNVKRAEIAHYLEHDLFPQVEEILANAASTDTKAVQEELATLEASLKDAGVDPATSPKVQDLRARLANTASQDELRQRAFSHLLTFFSRYYDKGDFISKRRYKDGTYMIPYNGEEVKLVWANMDQYYIKTSEYLRDYRFFLNAEKTLRMTFKLVEGDTERDNIKGKNRIFRILEDEPEGSVAPATVADDGLVARFEYVLSDTKQKDATAAAVATILDRSDRFRPYLEQKDDKSGKMLLEKHISTYTARNSEDYFIHKDLKSFLERELDFFLKNEVLRIDDMLGDGGEGMQAQLHLARAIKEVGGKIIAMLAQIEEFQKKLWLKRKMVTSTNYLVTLDKIIEKAPQLLPQIAANDPQRKEWVRLFAINEIDAYSEPISEGFLRANDKLVVDTRLFDRDFLATLLSSFDDIEADTDGLLVHSENSHALNLLQDRYREKVKCIYIDPPYNTDGGPIDYKNGYRSSSWVSLMADRLSLAKDIIEHEQGILVCTIDDFQQKELGLLLESTWGKESIAGVVTIRINPSGRPVPTGFAQSHEYAFFVRANTSSQIAMLPRSEGQIARYKEQDEDGRYMWELFRKRGSHSERHDRPSLYYPLFFNGGSLRVPQIEWDNRTRSWIIKEKPTENETVLYPIDEDGVERNWRWKHEAVTKDPSQFSVKKRGDDYVVYYKFRPKSDGVLPLTVWSDAKYSATEHGTGLLKQYFREYQAFSYPKSLYAVVDSINVAGMREQSATVLDFFAGSGTTGHAVINLNREDGGSRKYILVEMGEYFDTVLKPRIAKVVYSTDWKDGKPQSRDTGVSHLVKYIRLESYEDTLNNLTVPEQGEYSSLLEQGVDREFREGYLLGYMLDWEAGAARITTERFAHPFDSILNVAGDTVGERKPVPVDLVETFNYLIGLTVKSYYEVEGCRIVEGHDPAGDHVLVVWRDLDTTGNAALNGLFLKQRINIRDREFDLVYVNGDNNLENIRRDDETWKVRLIEHEFTARMFAESNT